MKTFPKKITNKINNKIINSPIIDLMEFNSEFEKWVYIYKPNQKWPWYNYYKAFDKDWNELFWWHEFHKLEKNIDWTYSIFNDRKDPSYRNSWYIYFENDKKTIIWYPYYHFWYSFREDINCIEVYKDKNKKYKLYVSQDFKTSYFKDSIWELNKLENWLFQMKTVWNCYYFFKDKEGDFFYPWKNKNSFQFSIFKKIDDFYILKDYWTNLYRAYDEKLENLVFDWNTFKEIKKHKRKNFYELIDDIGELLYDIDNKKRVD